MFLLKPYILLPLLFVAGGIWFRQGAPRTCPHLSEAEHIFVLTGDARRIPFAKRLLEDNPYRKLHIIGVGGDVPIAADLRGQVSTESASRTTHENALAIRAITDLYGIRRFAIVTTEDHMPRAMLLAERHVPGAIIIPCPVPLRNMDASRRLNRWFDEYLKFISTLIGVESRKN